MRTQPASPRLASTTAVAALFATFASLTVAPATNAQSITIGASQSNTLFEDPAGLTSAGNSPWLFTGMTDSLLIRRGLLQFDVSSPLPAGAVITSVSLRLHMSRSVAGIEPVSIHAMNASWGSGNSTPPGQGGGGAPAEEGDATWLYRNFDSATQSGPAWSTPGGDFDPLALATNSVGGVGFYQWSSPQLTADVARWLANPSQNFGWLLQTTEGVPLTAKRFDSQFATNPDFRPQLTINYIPQPSSIALLTLGAIVSRRRRMT
ncbi:MAG: DNRLRE domain-containing protein [Phycisphaerales bacterium]|nr:DNRLRE domain-containing protein [Phycisphaerales bacterium]